MKNCVGCGEEFEPRNGNQKRCVKDCGRSSDQKNKIRTVRRVLNEKDFIGVDGEGVTREDGTHDYVLIGCGQRYYHNPDGSALKWGQIFSFLWECFEENPEAVYVGYFLGYDFTMWLKSMSYYKAKMLLTSEGRKKRERTKSGGNTTPFPVNAQDRDTKVVWEFDILGTKRFKLRPRGSDTWMYINDAGSYFQASFLSTIDPNPKNWQYPIVTPEEFALIQRGKEKRATASFNKDMIQYMQLENEVMGRLMTEINRGLAAEGIKLSRSKWYGPGQAAQAWLRLIGAPTTAEIQECTPRWVLDAAQASYYGGWFEIMAHGHIPGNTYNYDINSAYPSMIAELPCLLHGKWLEGTGNPPKTPGKYRLLHAQIEGESEVTGPMPYRDADGRSYRPRLVSAWYWEDEIMASIEAGLVTRVQVDKWIQYMPCDCPPPISKIRDLYLKRLEVLKNSPQGKAYKIVYNSSYGKMAQSIGNPKYSNAIYASLITSGCRQMILKAIATHPHKDRDLVMVATDGVYFSTPHPSMDLDEERLGAWDATVHEDMCLIMPGVYWDKKVREGLEEGELPKLKSRGVSAKDLSRQVLNMDEQFKKWAPHETGTVNLFAFALGDTSSGDWYEPDWWPTVRVEVSFSFCTATLALARNDWSQCGTVDQDAVRDIDSNPTIKRNVASIHRHPVHGYWVSSPHPVGPKIESTPYDKRFGADWDEVDPIAMTQEGPASILLANMIH